MLSSTTLASSERDQSILNHLPQVKLLAARLHRRCPANVLLEDLVSTGVIGLIEATDRYDRRRNIKLKTLAEHRIRGAMLDYLRELDPLPRAVRSFIRYRDSIATELERRYHRVACDDEIAAVMHIPMERYRHLSRISRAGETISLGWLGGAAHNSREVPASDNPTPHTIALMHTLERAIESLPNRERNVILLLQAGYTSSEIAQYLNVMPSRVSHIKRSAIIRLRIEFGIVPANHPLPGVRNTMATERAS